MTIFAFTSCSTNAQNEIERIDGSRVPKDSLSYKIDQLAAGAKVHGLAVAIFDNNQDEYQHIVGYKDFEKKLPLTDSTNIYGASVSKAVFSIIVMKLVEDKVIDLDTPWNPTCRKKYMNMSQRPVGTMIMPT